jgi:hypothetical protein
MATLLLRLNKRFTSGWYFLWVFGCVSLMNSGRLLYSAISGTGDWSVVISTFTSPWLWRIVLAAAGVFIYSPAVSFAVAAMRDLIVRREIAYQDVWRLALVAYLTASGLLTAAAALNPVNDTLVALAVVGTSFGLNFGLLLVPLFISEPVQVQIYGYPACAFQLALVGLGINSRSRIVIGFRASGSFLELRVATRATRQKNGNVLMLD